MSAACEQATLYSSTLSTADQPVRRNSVHTGVSVAQSMEIVNRVMMLDCAQIIVSTPRALSLANTAGWCAAMSSSVAAATRYMSRGV